MSDLSWVPQSGTLPAEEQPLRVAEWDALFSGCPLYRGPSRCGYAWTWPTAPASRSG
ncbi:hypothetical protein [Streptomyces sp. NBC_01527]|uniref:hypothetical protein n=1 Tax=Streptomyces sp. NBC_01527 TaxID=2903894 RepID=UPI00386B0E2E